MPPGWNMSDARGASGTSWNCAGRARPGTDLAEVQGVMRAAGFQAYATVWDRTAMVDLAGTWESYWSGRKATWLQRFRNAEHKLSKQGEISYVRYRPLGRPHDDGSPRWDLYDACEEIARRSWQGAATNGTTLSHDGVRGFLREAHEAAAAAGAVDLNLLLIDGVPAAFLYNYHYRGYVNGLRRGYDAQRSREGAGNVLVGLRAARQLRPRRSHLRHGRGLAGEQAALPDAGGADPAAEPFPAPAGAGAVVARQALVAATPRAGVHRGRPCSGWHSRRAMNLRLPGGMFQCSAPAPGWA